MKKILILCIGLMIQYGLMAQGKSEQAKGKKEHTKDKSESSKDEKDKTENANEKLKLVIKGRVKDAATKRNIYDATVTLKGSDGTSEVIKTTKSGKYIFGKKKPNNTSYLKPNTNYTIEVKKEGYKSSVLQESTEGEEQETFVLDFLLEQEPE